MDSKQQYRRCIKHEMTERYTTRFCFCLPQTIVHDRA
nr:MAG TPA: hypothetical protein [Bacteriophage sp.]